MGEAYQDISILWDEEVIIGNDNVFSVHTQETFLLLSKCVEMRIVVIDTQGKPRVASVRR